MEELAASLGTTDPEVLIQHLSVGGSVIEDDLGWRVSESVELIEVVHGAHSHSQSVAPAPDGASVSALLDSALTAAWPTDLVEAELCLRRVEWKPVVSVWHEVDLAMLRGEVSTWGDVRRVINDARQTTSDAGQAAVDAFLSGYAGSGVWVEHVSGPAGCVKLSAPAYVLQDMVLDPVLTSADVANPPIYDHAGYWWPVDGVSIDGYELEDLLQSTQFYQEGYTGDERIGIIGGNDLYRRHVGFHDAAGADRLENCGSPDASGNCTTNPDPDTGLPHGTAVASIVLGDITADQDPNYTTGIEQRERSGVARGATGLGLGKHRWDETVPAAGIFLTVKTSGPFPDGLCLGDSSGAVKVNTLLEDGVFMAWSAGNEVDDGTCRVSPDQAAIGAFTVGGYHIDASDAEEMYAFSARGGGGCGDCYVDGPDNGNDDTRTIVDIMTPTGLKRPYPHYDTTTCDPPFDYRADWGTNCTGSSFCCTSGATPVAAGAAAVFREWWLAEVGTAINKPERLFTQMLLMGDRQGESAMLTEGFDELWGAGKLRLRKYDDAGMDAPAHLKWNNVCVGHNADVIVDITGSWSDVPADVDMIKMVVWWYDTRHDSGTEHDKIDLTVEWDNGGTWTEAATSTTDDNRQRVYISQPNNAEYRAVLTGRDVTTDVQGCGTDSMKVWHAAYMEDSDRDDGPSSDEPHYVRPE